SRHVRRLFPRPPQSDGRGSAPCRGWRQASSNGEPPTGGGACSPGAAALDERRGHGADHARIPGGRPAPCRSEGREECGHRPGLSARAVLDTSVFVAVEQNRQLARPLPEYVGVSVVTLAELELAVLMARDAETRATRLGTLTRLREQTAGLPADERVASAYARLAATELQAGRKPRVHDTWIAATALVHRAQVWTQDRDFTTFGGVDIVRL